MGEGCITSQGINPALEGFLAGLLENKADAAVAKAGKLQHALVFLQISPGNA